MGEKNISDTMKELKVGSTGTDDDSDRLIIGLDFGTTYSGVAYAFTTKPDQVYTVTEWPGASGRTVPKTPTVIKYDGPLIKWGYELERSTDEKIEAIKLLLDPSQPKPVYVNQSNIDAELKKIGKPARDVAADYIGVIYRHAITKIESKYPKTYLDMLNKQFVLSVPAVWSDKAKDATLRAARHAGIHPVELIKEPEAAALFTINFLKKQGLEVGDAIVICDAGGGTVDLISYEITKLAPLELSELVGSTGGLVGSIMLNRRFEQWIKDVVGERAFLDLRETDGYRRAMKQFEDIIKPGFQGEEDEDQYVNFPMANLKDDKARGVKANSITLTAAALYDIIRPLFLDIDKLVMEQVNKVQVKRMKANHPKGSAVKAIFLVGGFGSSIYLRKAIEAAHPDIQVIQPDEAWSAIVKGAVLSRLPQEAKVVSNVADKHYGVSGNAYYEEPRDIGQKKHWDDWENVNRCAVMSWFITKNDDLLRERVIRFPFFISLDSNHTDRDLLITTELLECSADKAPIHPRKNFTSKNCEVTSDLSKVPKTAFKYRTRKSDGKAYVEIHYNVVVSIQSGPMEFSLEIGGKTYGKCAAKY